MRLNRLVLRNFGLFRGEQILDFRLRSGASPRPIVLVGGRNGAGKTTLLEAVRLCLHGRLALGSRVSEAAYQNYLRERMHRAPNIEASTTYASVGVEFEYSHLGKRARYFVQRGWQRRGDGARELIRVLRNDKPLDDVDSALWPELVRSMIPPGVAQLFFFDGEKIKRFAEEETESLALAESIKALLGLDLVERLNADLDVFSAKHVRRTARAQTARQLRELDLQLQAAGSELANAEEEASSLADQHDALEAEILKVEDHLAQGGADFIARREALRQKEASLSAELSAAEKGVRELLDGAAPFLLCPRTADDLMRQLDVEHRFHDWEIGHTRARHAVRALRTRLTGPKNRRENADDRVAAWIMRAIDEIEQEFATAPEELNGVLILHELSEIERLNCVQTLQVAAPELGRRVALAAKTLGDLQDELRNYRAGLNRLPDTAELAPLVGQLSGLQEKHAKIRLEREFLDERIKKLRAEITIHKRERAKLEQDVLTSERASVSLALAAQAREAAAEYLGRLTAAKTAELERQALESFQRLSRKDDFVHRLCINPETYAVSLHDSKGGVIPKSSLSAGEKQIYAVSLLWGLARVSGRPLPMIVDTPLGRLDSRHRSNLIRHYFPAAAHQVILLSTDTEVDRTYYDELRSCTSHAYRLVDRRGWTEAEEGYFWETNHADTVT